MTDPTQPEPAASRKRTRDHIAEDLTNLAGDIAELPDDISALSQRTAEAFAAPTRDPRAIKAGRALDFVGQALLPLGLGAVAGFYAADQGVRWVPTMLGVLASLCVGSLLAMAVGRWVAGEAVTETARGLRLRKRVIAVVVLALVGVVVQVAMIAAQQPSPLTSLTPKDFHAAYAIDTQQLAHYDDGMARTLERVERAGFLNQPSEQVLSAEHEALLRQSWRTLRNYAIGLDQLRIFYEDYWRFDASRAQRAYHLRAFLLTFAAELALYDKASRWVALVRNNPNAVKLLNAPDEMADLPADAFSQFRQDLLGTRDQARVIAGERYLSWLDRGLHARAEAEALGVGWLWQRSERLLEQIRAADPHLKRADDTLRADTQLLKRTARRVWFPLQKGVAGWAGDTRTRRIGWYLIGRDLQEQMDPSLAPGDILVSRKNWYLSNVGLPGFWPHALLYIGTPDKLAAAFDQDPEVLAWVEAQLGTPVTFTQYLALRWPSRWRAYTLGQHGQPNRVIEAISEGVVFNTLDHASGDYLAAMRPRLSPLDKAKAIVYAFDQIGTPYDFDFDFATDHTLVCTELVWRAYRPGPDKAGLDLPTVTVAGRQTLPANIIVEHFATTHGTPDAKLDFVYFIDANEAEQRAFSASEEALLGSWKRPQWDIKQR